MDKKKLKIEVYDMEGVLQDAVEGACNGKNLHATMKDVIEQGAIPVVRIENEAVNPITKDWEPGLSFRIKIGNVEFDVSGQPDESKKMYERILEDLPRLVKMVNSDVEEMKELTKEIKDLMTPRKRFGGPLD